MGRLEMQREDGGLRHHLDGWPVHAGDMLEMLGDGGCWTLGRCESTFREDERPAFYMSQERGVFLRGDETLRWPPKI